MNTQQLKRMTEDKGFIAALDQSGGSTPKALALYGIPQSAYCDDEEMFSIMHAMRTRMITSPAFSSEYILGAILFKNTMDRKIDRLYTADYLWEKKGIVPFLKVDLGLQQQEDGVQLMKPITDLDETLAQAKTRNIFGTKMRSVIKKADEKGIKAIVEQQFEIGKRIMAAGFVPILEPEVDIYIEDKEKAEDILLKYVEEEVATLSKEARLMFKFSIPTKDGLYGGLMQDERVVRVVALSGGYSRSEADEKLRRNPGLIASFSRALSQGLSVNQTESEFNAMLADSVKEIYEASIS